MPVQDIKQAVRVDKARQRGVPVETILAEEKASQELAKARWEERQQEYRKEKESYDAWKQEQQEKFNQIQASEY